METTVAKSWKHLQELLFQDSYDRQIGRYRSSFIYRGMNDSEHTLKTSLARLGGPYDRLERHLLRNFQKYALPSALKEKSVWNVMAMGQHHGLPTRLLDWTYSPYVALHFATNDIQRYDRDGIIWATNYVALNQFLPEPLKKVIQREQSNTFTADMLNSVCRDLESLERLDEEEFLLFLEPPSLDERIVNQFALFSFLSSNTASMDEWLEDHDSHVFRIVVPKKLKWEIRDKLDQANITERVLFPGLDGLSMWLKRHYSSKNPEPDDDEMAHHDLR